MRKNKKIFGLIACSAVLAGAVVMGASNLSVAPAAADGEGLEFAVAQRAQVNYEESAIRFAATVSAADLANLGTTVVLKSSIDKMGGSDVAQTAEWVVKGEGSTYVDGYATNTYYHSISFSAAELDIRAAAAVDLTATMWLESDGVEVAGTRQSVTRAMRNVANAVYDEVEEAQQKKLGKYFATRETAKNAFKELSVLVTNQAEKYATAHWVVDGGVIPDAIYYNNEVFTGADLAAGETVEGSWTLWKGYNAYNVPSVTYVTNALEIPQEFNCMKLANTTRTGYYAVVVDDLNAAGLANANGNSAIFNAVLDGNGHTVTVKVPYYGLFGSAAPGATIKNIGFKISMFGHTKTSPAYRMIFFQATNGTHSNGDVSIDNVYLDFSEVDTTTYPLTNLCLVYVETAKTTPYKISNVIIDLGNAETNPSTTLLFRGWNQPNPGYSAATPTLENINVIMGASAIMAGGTTNAWYAQNDEALREADTTNVAKNNGMFGWQEIADEEGNGTGEWEKVARRIVNRYDVAGTSEEARGMYDDARARVVGNWVVSEDGTIAWSNTVPSGN